MFPAACKVRGGADTSETLSEACKEGCGEIAQTCGQLGDAGLVCSQTD